MTGTVLLIVVLLLAAMAMIVVEICTPTFGVLGLAALGCIGWAVYLAYTINGVFGLVMVIAVFVCFPIYIIAAVKILPKTPLGNLLHLGRDKTPPGEGTPEVDMLVRLVGRITTAETTLRPSGTVRIDDKRIIAQAESGMIEQGEEVKVIRAAGTHVVVRKVQDPASA